MHYHLIVGILESVSLLPHTPLPKAIVTWIRLNRLSVSDLAAFMSMAREGEGTGSLETQQVLNRRLPLEEMIKC